MADTFEIFHLAAVYDLAVARGLAMKYQVNFTPRAFVVSAIAYLSALESSEGKVYHITDPSLLSVDGMVALLGRATGHGSCARPRPTSWFVVPLDCRR